MEELNFKINGKISDSLVEKGNLASNKQIEELAKIKSKKNLADEENLQSFEEDSDEKTSASSKTNAQKTAESDTKQKNIKENADNIQEKTYETKNVESQNNSQEKKDISSDKNKDYESETYTQEEKINQKHFAVNAFDVSRREQTDNADENQGYKVAKTNLASSPIKYIAEMSANGINFISNSITGKSEPSTFEKYYENEREVIDSEIQEKFNSDKEELEKNKTLANCATTIVLKQVYKEAISDNEYANALLDLADSMIKTNIEGKYDSGLNKFLEENGYHTNAFGNIVDENNKEIETSEIVKELEDFVQEIYLEYEPKDEEYDEIVSETIALIQGDDSKLTSLSENIDKYDQKLAKKEEDINLKEEMLAELTAQKSELVASRASCGVIDDLGELFFMGNKAEENYYNERRELLEKAIVSDKYEDMVLAYQKIYFDKDVCINSEGKVCSFDSANENCTTEKIMNMETGDIDKYIELEIEESKEARELLELIENGNMSLDGEIISVEYIADILIAQTTELMQDANNAACQQGDISKWISTGNSLFGLGTSEPEMKAQIQQYTAQVNELKNCKDPERFAAIYKSLTGEDFSVESMATLLAYDSMKNPKEENSNKTANNKENVVALDEFIDNLTDQVNEAGNGNTDLLLVVGNTKAAESIKDYISTQHTIKEAVIGVATGIVATLAVTFAPVTGGLSLLVGAGVGAGANTLFHFLDSSYDSDNDLEREINYSLEDAGKDAILGAVNGSVGVISNGVGNAVTRTIANQAGKAAVATTFKESARNVLISIGSKTAGAAVEGFIDGSISAGGEYSLSALMGEREFSTEELLEVAVMGGTAGSIFNVGVTGAKEAGQLAIAGLAGANAYSKIKGGNPSDDSLAELTEIKNSDQIAGTANSDSLFASWQATTSDFTQTTTGNLHIQEEEIMTKSTGKDSNIPNKGIEEEKSGATEILTSKQNAEITNTINTSKIKDPDILKKITQLSSTYKTKQVTFNVNGEECSFTAFIGSQAGSNSGGYVVNNSTGELFYYKTGSTSQSKTEVLASKLYKKAGIDVPELTLYTDASGNVGLLSKYIPDLTPVAAPNQGLAKGFGMDALLANWDAVCSNNAVTNGTDIYRIDVGGTFDFRAQGGKKAYTSIVDEVTTLIDPKYNSVSSNLFSSMTKGDLIDSLQRVADLSDDDIIQILQEQGMTKYQDVLLKRKQFLVDLLAEVKKMPDDGTDMLTLLTKAKTKTYETSISRATSLQDIEDIQSSINNIQDIYKKQNLQGLLDIKKANITSNMAKIDLNKTGQLSQIDEKTFEELLETIGIVRSEYNTESINLTWGAYTVLERSSDYSEGIYKYTCSEEIKAMLIKEYGTVTGTTIINSLETNLCAKDIKIMRQIMNSADGAHIEYFTNNMTDLLYLYQILRKSHEFMKNIDNITSAQWGMIINTLKNKPNKNELASIMEYKSNSAPINTNLTSIEINPNHTFSDPEMEKQINTITSYIDTQEIPESITVYRGEGYSVFDTVEINGEKLSTLMKKAAASNNQDQIDEVILLIEENNLVAHQERFMSTSIFQENAFKDDINWILELPEGTKGVFIEGINYNSTHNSECELLLQRGYDILLQKAEFINGEWYMTGKIISK